MFLHHLMNSNIIVALCVNIWKFVMRIVMSMSDVLIIHIDIMQDTIFLDKIKNNKKNTKHTPSLIQVKSTPNHFFKSTNLCPLTHFFLHTKCEGYQMYV